jgi:hypothetical protein
MFRLGYSRLPVEPEELENSHKKMVGEFIYGKKIYD